MPSSVSGDDYTTKLSSLTAENSKLRQKLAALSNNLQHNESVGIRLLWIGNDQTKEEEPNIKKCLEEEEEKRGCEAVAMSSVIP